MNRLSFLLAIALAFSTLPLSAHEAAEDMAAAAADFLGALSPDQREIATYGAADTERENWAFIPKPFAGEGMRGGLTLKAMEPNQRHLAYALLSSGLSHRGYATALQIMSLEHVLWEMENADHRDTLMYYFSIFGDPGSESWGWRVEGHHLSVNFTIVGGKVVSGTPNFFASNPGEITEGPRKGLRVLANEEDVARSLVKSLNDEQRATAIFDRKAPEEILTAAESSVTRLEDAGIFHSELTAEQQTHLDKLIDVYVKRIRPEVAADDLAAIEAAGKDKITFAWAGSLEAGEAHYYRVQGPTFLLEYANTQNDAKHVHAVWRDFDGDFGRDILADHYREQHSE